MKILNQQSMPKNVMSLKANSATLIRRNTITFGNCYTMDGLRWLKLQLRTKWLIWQPKSSLWLQPCVSPKSFSDIILDLASFFNPVPSSQNWGVVSRYELVSTIVYYTLATLSTYYMYYLKCTRLYSLVYFI